MACNIGTLVNNSPHTTHFNISKKYKMQYDHARNALHLACHLEKYKMQYDHARNALHLACNLELDNVVMRLRGWEASST